jgi:predicted nucleic acid-binding protein
MKRIMLDTNILISGIVFSGVERMLINVCSSRGYTIVLSEIV